MSCLTCGSNEADPNNVRYFAIPGMVMVPNSYILCKEHEDLRYDFYDIYDENSKRKEIDHAAVIARCKDE